MLKNLKSLRLAEKISQQQLADIIGVSQQSVNKYENHAVEPDIDTIIKIADYFSVSVDYLIGRTETSDYALTDDEKQIITAFRHADTKDQGLIRFILFNK